MWRRPDKIREEGETSRHFRYEETKKERTGSINSGHNSNSLKEGNLLGSSRGSIVSRADSVYYDAYTGIENDEEMKVDAVLTPFQ